MSRLLVIMGSGETAPTMVKPHREIFAHAGDRRAVLLDTPYGFQSNAADISTRAVSYFAASVGRTVEVAPWRVAPPPGLDRERVLAAVKEAGWVFAGPGSPTYALRQWRDTPLPGLFAEKLHHDGVLVFASAAALTLGSHTVPVYEIYKAGFDPHWVPGLDLVASATGLPAVVIPHYDNAEGGHHDTRFCYLGEQRLAAMERELPEDGFVLGVDEHTAVVMDLDAGTASVIGNGTMTIRRHGRSVVHPSGSVLALSGLGTAPASTAPASTAPAGTVPSTVPAGSGPGGSGYPVSTVEPGAIGGGGSAGGTGPAESSLRAAADRLRADFDTALAARDVDGCVSALLDLEGAIRDWAADTLTSDEGDHARATLRAMVVRLGELATVGARDPRTVLTPYVELALELRRRARDGRDFATSDWIRDALAGAGVEVRDTPGGVEWSPTGNS
jgi:cyanophycinase-like exopeptidase